MYKFRMKIFVGVVTALLLVTIGRLGQLQLRAAEYLRRAEAQLTYTVALSAQRGRVLDRNDTLLARNDLVYSLCLDYRFLVQDPDWIEAQLDRIQRVEREDEARAQEIYRRQVDTTLQMARRLAERQGVDFDATVERIVQRVKRLRQRVGQRVREEEQLHPVVTGLSEKGSTEGTIGVEFRTEIHRAYPLEDVACHIIGVMGRISAEKLARHNLPEEADWQMRLAHNYEPDDLLGVEGIERVCEEILRGQRGYRRTRRMAQGPVVIEHVPAQAGQDVQLSIDAGLQAELAAMFQGMAAGHNGSIVVLSVPDGEVLAMVSSPTYDLNTYHRDFTVLNQEAVELPLHHRAISTLYPPGSTVKPLAALGALTDDIITTETTFNCRGYLDTPDSFRCWIHKYGTGHGDLNVIGAMKHSCNVYLYNVGELLGVPAIHYWHTQFGFCDKPGTGLPGEAAGKVNDEGTVGESRMMAIGQGPVAVTPLHVANAMATIARDGLFLSPVVIRGPGEARPPQIRRQVEIPPWAFEAITEGMYQVVNSPGATAYKYFHGPGSGTGEPLSVVVCGKTGTAQTPPGREGDMAWFAGFAPRENPTIAFAVVVEYVTEGGGASVAGPIAREAIRLCQFYRYVD